MSRTQSAFHNRLLGLALITGGTLIAGCMEDAQPVLPANADLPAIVDGDQIAVLPAQGEIRYTRTAAGDAITVTSPRWAESSPGLWKSPEENSGATMIIGAAGHRAAITEGERRLAQLEHQAELGANTSTEIEQQLAQLGVLRQAEQEIARRELDKPTDANALPPICNFNFYIGPSSPVVGTPGAAALATAWCSGSCQVMTSTSLVCTNIVGCTQVQTQSALVCGLPVRFGTVAPGTSGFTCSGAATMLPPGAGTANPFICS